MSTALTWSLSAADIKRRTDELIFKARKVYDDVAALSDEQCNFKTVVEPLARMDSWWAVETSNLTFPQHVNTNKDVRDAAVEANKALDEFEIEQSMREDLYTSILATKKKGESVDPESARLLEFLERDFRRNGLALPKEQRDELKKLKQRLADICTEYGQTLAEDKTEVTFTKEELDGLPEDFFEGRKKVDVDGTEKYVVTMKYPDVLPIMRMAKCEQTRKVLDLANGRKCQSNIALLEEAVRIRAQIAKMLGYENHAAFKLEIKMAKDLRTTETFLKELMESLKPYGEKEKARLLELKKGETAGQYDGRLNSWDYQYYNRLLLERDYAINNEEIKQYFSLSSVTEKMLRLYESIMGIKVTESKPETTWHPDVKFYTITDAETNELVGQFYLDLHPREGKYTHAAVFPLQPSCEMPDGKRQHPIAAMVANFSAPTPSQPSLLKHDEVVTFFHELGHVVHELASKTKWTRFAGTRVEGDFVEAPSQMLENWCWDRETLPLLSSHHATGAPLPESLITSLINSKTVNAALFNLRQLFFGWFDYQIHTVSPEDAKNVDTTALWTRLRNQVTLIDVPQDAPETDKTWGHAAFGHMMGGYDAGYYGYLYSQVFSADMFYSRFKKNPLDAKIGKEYRKKVLQPGASHDGRKLVEDFLGREVRREAFLVNLGLMKEEDLVEA
ncbi:Thimet oligopeptidase [Gaertneriomyces sp. JEL0708]|nr:Thimet oligopeptidase [Gaertneriomyces sp. JEL0708]